MRLVSFFLISIMICFVSIQCREQTPFQKKMMSLKKQINALKGKNADLEELYEDASKSKKVRIDRRIATNSKKIKKLNRRLSKMTKGTQNRVLDSISSEAKRRAQ